MRRAMGTAVFSGMIGVTFFGLLMTPVFYVVLMTPWRKKARAASPSIEPSPVEPRPEAASPPAESA
jgi:hypothetical protein